MKKYKNLYPITVEMAEVHLGNVSKIFKEVRPHKEGSFIGVAVLEGGFYIENKEEIFRDLKIGEKLILSFEPAKNPLTVTPITVHRLNGTDLGFIPVDAQALLNMLMCRGIELFAFCEAKSFKSDILKIAVSLYCENY